MIDVLRLRVLWVYVCMSMSWCVGLYVRMCQHVCLPIGLYVRVYMHMPLQACVRVCVRVCTLCTCAWMCSCVCQLFSLLLFYKFSSKHLDLNGNLDSLFFHASTDNFIIWFGRRLRLNNTNLLRGSNFQLSLIECDLLRSYHSQHSLERKSDSYEFHFRPQSLIVS